MTSNHGRIGARPAVIDGRPRTTPEVIEVLDPSDGSVLATVPRGGRELIDEAVTAARRAFDRGWRRTTAAERAALLGNLARLLRDHGDELAELESRDVGKPLRQGRTDVNFIARYFEFYRNLAEAHFGQVIPAATDRITMALREPHGVTAHVIPWNFPLGIVGRTIAPALAAGNCCVLKPAEDAPLSTIRVAELALEAGFPPGVLNVVPGYGEEAGHALVSHPGVDHISFTGSVEVGRRIAAAAAQNLKTVTLELGGKSPNVVLADADLGTALPHLAQAILLNAGQTCSAGSRIVVADEIHDEVVDGLVKIFQNVTIGRGTDDPDLGPLISAKQRTHVLDAMEAAANEGDLRVGGGEAVVSGAPNGFFVEPSIFDNVSASADLAQREVFGPVLTVTPVRDHHEALVAANATRYGLGAGVWTRDVSLAHWFIRELDCGQVMVNTFSNGVEMPFSGRKDSGYGTEKSFEALNEFTRLKGAVVAFGDV